MFKVLVVEPDTDDAFGPEVAEAMRLPFDSGWAGYGIFQDDEKIADIEDYGLAVSTCHALNNTVVLQAA